MAKRQELIRIALLTFLIGGTVFSGFKYISYMKERHNLVSTIKQLGEQIQALETEKQGLFQGLEKEKDQNQRLEGENAQLNARLTKLDADFTEAQQAVERLSAEITLLRAENVAVREQDNSLKLQFTQLVQERDTLKVRLSSLPELKKAIRDLKVQMRLAVRQKRHQVEKGRFIVGNKGYVIREGKSTLPTKIIIQVIPASTERPWEK